MNWYGEMVRLISEDTGVSSADVRKVLRSFYNWAGGWLRHRGEISIRGFGRFKLSSYELPQENNPGEFENDSGQAIRISFRASPKWRLLVLRSSGGARAEQGRGW